MFGSNVAALLLAVVVLLIIVLISYRQNLPAILLAAITLAYFSSGNSKKVVSGGFNNQFYEKPQKIVNDKFYIPQIYLKYNDIIGMESYKFGVQPEFPGNHFGQRKLLVSEVMFLSMKAEPDKHYYIIYAGAAPNFKYPVLHELFENCTFILVDPNPFGVWIDIMEHIKIEGDNPDMAEIIKGSKLRTFVIHDIMSIFIADKLSSLKNKLFISDIRTNLIPTDSISDYDVVLNNMQHIVWINHLNPKWYMLKYRAMYELPQQLKFYSQFMSLVHTIPEWVEFKGDEYIDNHTKMPKALLVDGDIYIQAWPGYLSGECRIVGNNPKLVRQDPNLEAKFFYYNMYLRNHPASHAITYNHLMPHKKYILFNNIAEQYCGCNDCRIELHWIKNYCDVYEKDINKVCTLFNIYTQNIRGHGTRPVAIKENMGSEILSTFDGSRVKLPNNAKEIYTQKEAETKKEQENKMEIVK